MSTKDKFVIAAKIVLAGMGLFLIALPVFVGVTLFVYALLVQLPREWRWDLEYSTRYRAALLTYWAVVVVWIAVLCAVAYVSARRLRVHVLLVALVGAAFISASILVGGNAQESDGRLLMSRDTLELPIRAIQCHIWSVELWGYRFCD